MKLRTLAIAVAMASVPFAAQADVKISGDIGVGYFKTGGAKAEIRENGSEINVDASEKVGGITYFGHLEMDIAGGATTSNVSVEELRVGAMGGFGEVRLGHLGDNGCARVQTGGSYEVWLTHNKGGCTGTAKRGISYTKTFGKISTSVSHVPQVVTAGSSTSFVGIDTTDPALGITATQVGNSGVWEQTITSTATSEAESSIGLAGTFGPVTASVGYTNAAIDNTAMGLSGKIGPVSVGFRYDKNKGGDAEHGVNMQYTTRTGLSLYGGFETSDPENDGRPATDDKQISFGAKKVVGSNTDFIFEVVDTGGNNNSTSYGLGMRHRF